MAGNNRRSKRAGILIKRVIECPVCEQRAHSFRIVRVKDLHTVEREFYHRTAKGAGSMAPGIAAAMDLLRVAAEDSSESQ
jgi:hypothetical protein